MERHGPWERLQPGTSAPGAGAGKLAPVAPLVEPGPEVRDAEGLRTLLRQVLGGDDRVFTDPLGARVRINMALAEHILASPDRLDASRERFFPLLPELIERPQEIWVGFARHPLSGKVTLRRRYIRLVQVDKDRVLGLVADLDNNLWSGLTFFFGRARGGVDALRIGVRAYAAAE